MKKRIVAVLLLTMLLSTLFVAEAEKLDLRMETHTYWENAPYMYTVFTENLPEDAKLVSIKSSNPSVLKAEKWGSDKWDAVVGPLKPGTSTITVVYKIKGKKVTVNGTFTVKKSPNAIKALTLNNQAINVKKNRFEAKCYDLAANKITIKVTPASGWKLAGPIEILSEGCSYKTVKNGKTVKISLKKPRVAALITLRNKLNEEFEYELNLTY